MSALTTHRETESLERFQEELRARAEQGDASAKQLLENPQTADLVTKSGMLPDQIYIDPREILAELKKRFPQTFDKVELPATASAKPAASAGDDSAPGSSGDSVEAPLSKSDLIPIHIWRSVLEDERNQLISTAARDIHDLAQGVVPWRRDSLQSACVLFLVVVRGSRSLSA